MPLLVHRKIAYSTHVLYVGLLASQLGLKRVLMKFSSLRSAKVFFCLFFASSQVIWRNRQKKFAWGPSIMQALRLRMTCLLQCWNSLLSALIALLNAPNNRNKSPWRLFLIASQSHMIYFEGPFNWGSSPFRIPFLNVAHFR